MRAVDALLMPGQPARGQRQLVGVGRETICQVVSCWHGGHWRASGALNTSLGTLREEGFTCASASAPQ